MKKLSIGLLIVMTMLFSALPAARAQAADYLSIEDTSRQYTNYNGFYGLVRDLADPTDSNIIMDYDIPQAGATVIIFFGANTSEYPSGCGNSDNLISQLGDAEWAYNEDINIIAVESYGGSKQEVSDYIDQHDPDHVIDKVYYAVEGRYMYADLWYKTLVERNGNMEGSGVSGSIGFAYVLIVTPGSNGEKLIRYSQESTYSVQDITDALADLVDTVDVQKTRVTVSGYARYDMVQEVFDLVNSNRQSNGCQDLILSGPLTEMAMQRAAECAFYYDHTRPNGRFFSSIEEDSGYSGVYALAENIAYGFISPSDVMTGWMNSPGHRANILLTDVDQIGVGCFENNGTLYWVQLFGVGEAVDTPAYNTIMERDADVETLASHLDLYLTSWSAITVPVGSSVDAPILGNYNSPAEMFTVLRPVVLPMTDSSGQIIATYVNGPIGSGKGAITGVKAGNGKAVIKASSDSDVSCIVQLEVTGIDGHTVKVDDRTAGAATVSGIVNGNKYSGKVGFTVSCDDACAVLCTTDGGKTYTRLTATAGNNGYSFSIDVTQEMTIVVALKGDVNLDGVLKNQDVTMAKAANLGKRTLSTLQEMVADVTGDGIFKNQDITKFKAALLGKTTLGWDI